MRFFFIKDRVEQGDVKIEYKATEDMLAHVLTKSVHGSLFIRLRDFLLNNCLM